MTQIENTIKSTKGKHLTYKERVQIETFCSLEIPLSGNQIAKKLGRARRTIHKEIKDGTVRQVRKQVQNGKEYRYDYFVYSADAGQTAYEKARKHSSKQHKWVKAPNFMAYADHQMKEKNYFPDVIVGRAKKLNLFPEEDIPCTTKIYNYIDQDFMETKNMDLHLKVRRRANHTQNRKNKKTLGDLIEKHPDIVDSREEFGHWEIDTVVGLKSGTDQALLTLTERKTRYEVIIKIDGKASNPVNQALSTLKAATGEHFGQLFQTITSDNGSEFSGLTELLKEVTDVYFIHPYSSWERETNENHNDLIRRFIPKETRMLDLSLVTIRKVQYWMNTLPRRILGYATPRECLIEEMRQLQLVAYETA
ncbi:IS30 family transposase [Enterococcus faecalis]|uniref:IS30 family transposase n=1 Tax=Enterococcus faecalis TaxID=1351 RepID=UPI00115F0EE4|nr:IS30 family transposase [Enterococcus faecalis]HAP5371627.1 IS30 family transposase [Enterococcus faecalis]